MRKKALVILLIIVAIIVASVIAIVSIVKKNSGVIVDENGVTIVTVNSSDTLDKYLSSDTSKLCLKVRNKDIFNNTELKDTYSRTVLVIDGGGTTLENFQIVSNAEETIIKNISLINTSKSIIVLNKSISKLTLENCSIEAKEDGVNAIEINSQSSTLEVIGIVNVIGGAGTKTSQNGGSAINAKNIQIIGEASKLTLTGGKAAPGRTSSDGQRGTSYDTSSKKAPAFTNGCDGCDGGRGSDSFDGTPAGQGGDALVAKDVDISGSLSVYLIGGDGNQSGSSGMSGAGGNGEGGTCGNPWQIESYRGGRGGDSGNSGNAADEIRPGYGIVCDTITISETKVYSRQGKRGSAGKAGDVAEPGVGGYSSGGSLTNWEGHDRASSGSYGKKGADGKSIPATETFYYKVKILIGTITTI